MTLYTDVDMEPIPIRCDAAVNRFQINPALPEGMILDETTGTISGRLTKYNNEDIIYTVTATTDNMGSTSTVFTFRARSQSEMTTVGAIGCYWKTITECKVPDFDFFYKNPAQVCQRVNELYFTDNNVDNTWPGLDRRFVNYYSAYFYTYVLISYGARYDFRLSSDDGALLFVDDLTTPLISRESCRAKSETAGSKELSVGRHLVVIRFFEYNLWSSLYLKFGSEELGIELDYLKAEHMRVGGRGPTFVSYDFITGFVNTDIPYYMPQIGSGAPTSWTITPNLPQGLIMDSNGYISGRPSEISSGVYTVTAHGVNGAASATVNIVISNTMNTGFRTKFYEITDYEMCNYNMLTGNAIRISQIINNFNDINYPKTTENLIWPGFPYNFDTYFYMEWEGYMKMDAIGYYRMRLSCDDGCKLIAAGEQTIIDNWGCHSYSSMETKYAVSKVGYYYFRIEYQQKESSKGIVFEWQVPGGVWEVVPSTKVVYLPTKILNYRYEQMHYFMNVAIQENYPILFSVSSVSNFRIFPDLPAGLTMSPQTGRIQGVPTTTQIMTPYTVTASNGANDISTVILFDITDLAAPSELSYMYAGSVISISTPVTLVPLRPMGSMSIHNPKNCVVGSYSIRPNLPAGLSMDATTGTISGTPNSMTNSGLYTVTATNAAGFFEIIFSLSVDGCKGISNNVPWTGEFIHVWFRSGEGSVKIIGSDNQPVRCSVDTMKADGNAEDMLCSVVLQSQQQAHDSSSYMATFCVNPAVAATASIQATCTINNGCRWQVTKDNGLYYPYRHAYTDLGYAPYIDTMPYPTTSTPLSTLTLSKNSITVYSGYLIETVPITVNGCYESFTITPSFGSVTIDPGYPLLAGIASGSGVQTYTITATGSSGTASATLTVTYGECSSATGQRLINFKKTTFEYGTEESWELYQGTIGSSGRPEGTLLYNSGILASSTTYYVSTCLAPGDYVIVLLDTYGDGWNSGGTLTALDTNDNELQSWTYRNPGKTDQKEKLYAWPLEAESGSTEWRYLIDKKPGKDWNKANGDRSSWNTITYGTAGPWTQNGVYFVHEFELTDGDAYPIVEFGIFYRDGVIVYLNGQEVYRRNMATNSPSQKTLASGSFDGYLMRVGTAAGYLLVSGKNLLAIEMHRVNGVSGNVEWNSYVKLSPGDCEVRSTGGSIRESLFYDKFGETAAEAWDNDLNTQWTENGLPAWTVYSYDFDHVEWINRVTISSNKDNKDTDPSKFSMYGSNDGVNWDHLYTYSKDDMFKNRRESQSFMMMDHMNSYGQYKFEVSKTYSGVAQVSISTLALEACRLIYCPKDGDYPGTPSGVEAVIDCPKGFIGERYRRCSDDRLKPSWGEADESECLSQSPPKGTSYIDAVYVFAPMDKETMETSGANAVSSILASKCSVSLDNVKSWKVKDVTDSFVSETMTGKKTALWVRVSAPNERASKLTTVLGDRASLKKDLISHYGDVFGADTDIAFYKEPELSQYKGGAVSAFLIIILVVLVLIVVSIVAFYLWTRLKNKSRKNGARKLNRSGVKKSSKETKSSRV